MEDPHHKYPELQFRKPRAAQFWNWTELLDLKAEEDGSVLLELISKPDVTQEVLNVG